MKIINVWLFQKLSTKQCPSSLLWLCEDSLTKGLCNLFIVWWPCPSFKVTTASQTWHRVNMHYNCNISQYLCYGVQTWHDIYADAHFDDLDLDTRSQWNGKEKQTAHDGRLMHDIIICLCSSRWPCLLKTFVWFVLGWVFFTAQKR